MTNGWPADDTTPQRDRRVFENNVVVLGGKRFLRNKMNMDINFFSNFLNKNTSSEPKNVVHSSTIRVDTQVLISTHRLLLPDINIELIPSPVRIVAGQLTDYHFVGGYRKKL